MKRLNLCHIFALVPLMTALSVTGTSQTALADDPQPNIVWLMAEDMGLDLECYGAPGVKTPHLNQMAKEGALYNRAYCPNPICGPNRSSMMVGVDPTRINAQHHRSNRDIPLQPPFKPITSMLRDAGYTCILGSNLVMMKGTKIDCNFKNKPVGPYDGVTNFGLFDKIGDFTPKDQPFFNQIQLKVTYRGDWWQSVRDQSPSPVSPEDVELPPYFADTPQTRYDWAAYLDQVEYMDREVGAIMQSLKDQGLDKNTIVIFIADNGRCNLRGKGYLYEPGIKVPMIVWAPGRVEPGKVVNSLVSTSDISATVLALANADRPDYLEGRMLLGEEEMVEVPYIRSIRDIWDEIDECSRSVTTQHFKYIRNYMPEVPWDAHQAYLDLNRPAVHVMRRLKSEDVLSPTELTFFRDHKPLEELYDLENDPHELTNLAGNPQFADVLEQHRLFEQQWLSRYRDHGIEDLGQRTPDTTIRSVLTVDAVKRDYPEVWRKLESGKLLQTQTWHTKYLKRTND